jgi:hypothetical protein
MVTPLETYPAYGDIQPQEVVVIDRHSPRQRLAVIAFSFLLGASWFAVAENATTRAPRISADNSSEASKSREIQYLELSAAAMTKMMREMQTEPTGDVDRDFVAQMVPHHQGAIDMAVAILRTGQNEPLRRMAHEIIVTQQQEIAAMRFAIGEQATSAATPTN